MTSGLQVRGNASAEEVAVVVALMSQVVRGPEPDRYAQWRRTRLAAIRPRPSG